MSISRSPKKSRRWKQTPHEPRRRELRTAAKVHGWQAVETFADESISGAKLRDKRRPAWSMHGSRWYRAMIRRTHLTMIGR